MNRFINYIRVMLDTFARVTTLVTFFTAIYIIIFWGADCELGVEILWQILAVSGMCALGVFIHPGMADKELSKWGVLLRLIGYYLYINVIVLTSGIRFRWFFPSNWKMLLGMELVIFAVFMVVLLIHYLFDYKTAEKMNEKLRER